MDGAVVLDPAGAVGRAAVRAGEGVELAPPHPASATATATPHAATPRTRELTAGRSAERGYEPLPSKGAASVALAGTAQRAGR